MEPTSASYSPTSLQRLSVVIRGAVQGVGFRPFIYRLATELGLFGWVSNTAQGVFIEVDGPVEVLDRFLLRLRREVPPRAFIQSLESRFLDPAGFMSFKIRQSETAGAKTALILPDIATCPECLSDILDPSNRRHRYPFTNCTNCGPRFTIIEQLPYDRPNTSMKKFPMCPACRAEYHDPTNRRFHAQPNACPVCGPHLELWDVEGKRLAEREEALLSAVDRVRRGEIVAVKGLGGFHLIVDARNDEAVGRLRERKQREEKPFALMVPDLDAARRLCAVDDLEGQLLTSPEAPIVLLERAAGKETVAPGIAPGNPTLGLMLPYTPLHHVLMRELRSPLVATSGNRSDEPICIDEREALVRLKDIADVFLVHDRPIVRHVDDSVARILLGRELVMRRARGYAPLPVAMKCATDAPPLVAVGAHLKNTVALVTGGNAFLSQHIGDLETSESLDAFRRVIADLQRLYDAPASRIACDIHPDYRSSTYAHEQHANVVEVQHHHAHICSCMAENELDGPVLGVAWDGTGLGTDGTIWGGEFLLTDGGAFSRCAWFRPFRLPGGDAAIKQPRRVALGMLVEAFGPTVGQRTDLHSVAAFTVEERRVLLQAIERSVNAPWTSSVGRLFDGVASLIGLRQVIRHEGQAAMELEFLVSRDTNASSQENAYRIDLTPHGGAIQLNWVPLLSGILEDVRLGVSPRTVATKFHDALAESIVAVASSVGRERIVLSGGCFQNRYLTEQAVTRLRTAGFRPYWHQRVPPNDGGIALGQAYAAFHQPK